MLRSLELWLYRALATRHERRAAAQLPPGPKSYPAEIMRCPVYGAIWIDPRAWVGRKCMLSEADQEARAKPAEFAKLDMGEPECADEFSPDLLRAFLQQRTVATCQTLVSENELYAALVAWLMTAHPQTTIPAPSKVRLSMEKLGYEYIHGEYSEETLIVGIGLAKERSHLPSEARI